MQKEATKGFTVGHEGDAPNRAGTGQSHVQPPRSRAAHRDGGECICLCAPHTEACKEMAFGGAARTMVQNNSLPKYQYI